MRKACVWLGAILLLGVPVWAQEVSYPRAEGFLGWSLGIAGGLGNQQTRQFANGFLLSGSANFNRFIGVSAEFGSQFRSAKGAELIESLYQYRAGPRLTFRTEKGVTAFAQAMFGGMTIRGVRGLPDAGTGFALGAGGGLEINAKNRFGVRIFQFDYIPRRFEGQWRNNFRVASGVTIKLGNTSF